MRPVFDTIRSRILAGLVPLVVGLAGAALLGAGTLRQMREAVGAELEGLRASGEAGGGLVTAVFEEMRAAERYLSDPGADARRQFQAVAEEVFRYERRLEALGGLAPEDRITVTQLEQLHASIEVAYSIAHALKDLVRDLAVRQAAKAARAADRLAAASRHGEQTLWLILVVMAAGGGLVARWTLQSVQAPLGRLVTASERFGSGDLRPVTVGEMPLEFRVLAEAMHRMGDRLRRIVGEVIVESDRIAGSAGGL